MAKNPTTNTEQSFTQYRRQRRSTGARKINDLAAEQNRPIKYVAWSGGGAKGTIYSGAYEALEQENIWQNVEAIAGSSAGAITAALAAAGTSSTEFKKISANTNLETLLGKAKNARWLGPSTGYDGSPLYQMLHKNINKSVRSYIDEIDIQQECNDKIATLTEEIETISEALSQGSVVLQENEKREFEESFKKLSYQREKLQNFLHNNGDDEIKARLKDDTGKVLFKDIGILSILEPTRFKKLIVTATPRVGSEIKLFDDDKTPDAEVALATQASAAFPIVFAPVTIDGAEYVDGGCRDNIPQTYFEPWKEQNLNKAQLKDDDNIANQKGRVLALAFGSGSKSEGHIAIHSEKNQKPKGFFSSILDRILRKLVQKRDKGAGKQQEWYYSQDNYNTYKTLRDNALNAILLDTGNVGTLSFDEAQKQSAYLHQKGLLQTRRHIKNHSNQGLKKSNNSLEMQEFMICVYENAQSMREKSGIIKQGIVNKNDKLQYLLEYCKDSTWNGKTNDGLIKDFILTAALDRRNNNRSSSTKTMKILCDVLNDPVTPDSIKQDFKVVLGLEKDIDSFSIKDFKNFIDQNKDKIPEIEQQLSSKKNHHVTQDKKYTLERKSQVEKLKEQRKNTSLDIKARS